MKVINDIALISKKNSLILFWKIDHGQDIYDSLMKDPRSAERKIVLLSGKNKLDEREELRALMEVSDDVIAVASYGIFSTGVSVKNIFNLVFASSYKSMIKVCQSIGRGLRALTNKTHLTLYDIVDVYPGPRPNSKPNYSVEHSISRVKIYNDEQFDYEMVSIEV